MVNPGPNKMSRATSVMVRALLTIWFLRNMVNGIGVNWGNIASHPLNAPIVVNMLKDNGIDKVKLFDADPWAMDSLRGTNIEVMVGIPNDQLMYLSESYGAAKYWVKENVTDYLGKNGVNIKYVAVGNEPFLTAYNNSFVQTTFPAFKNIQKALNAAGHGDKIKATIPQNAEVYDTDNDLPSGGNFRSDIRSLMVEIVQFFNDNGSPFTVNIYPYLSLYQNKNFPLDYAFFDGNGQSKDDDGVNYNNVFDANYDSLVWALKKAGVPDLKILVGEVGWPTDGDAQANLKLAERFYDGLMKRMENSKGTPMRPEKMEIYLFSLLDENMKSIEPGPFERHWGIFTYDGKPKFNLDFSAKGRNVFPVGAKGVKYMENKWCLYEKKDGQESQVASNIDFACNLGDCTSLLNGGSCNKLDNDGNISYAFNMYYQMQGQDVRACDFGGMGKMVSRNLSQGSCLFPIQIVSASNKLGFGSLILASAVGFMLNLFLI